MNRNALGCREGGAVLIVTLMFLVILTLLGVTAMTSTTMEERMSGNTRDSAIALQAAESALRDARRDISKIPVTGKGRAKDFAPSEYGDGGVAGTCGTGEMIGLCRPANNKDGTEYEQKLGAIVPSFPGHNLLGAPSVQYGQITGAAPIGGAAVPTPATQPRYIIEGYCLKADGESMGEMGNKCNFYRITARGYGRNPNTQITLQETFVSL